MDETELESLVAGYTKDHLSPKDAEREVITRRYEQLQKFLVGRTFQSGSYARFTSTTPVNDLDVIYVLPEEVLKLVRTAQQVVDPGRLDIHQIVDSLAEQLRAHYGRLAAVEAQPHSVGIFFGEKHEFSMDVVPAAPAEDGKFWVPEVARRSIHVRRDLYRTWAAQSRVHAPPGPNWIRSHPRGYIEQAKGLDESTEGAFRRATKVLKKWRWHRKRANDAFRLKSFHLEMAVTRFFQRSPNARCIDAIGGVSAELHQLIITPQFPDLADSTQYIDRYVSELTAPDRELLEREFTQAQYLWAEVERAKTADEARSALEAFVGLARPALGPGQKQIVALPPLGPREGEEEFLSDYSIPFRPQYQVKIDATVSRDGFRPYQLLARFIPLFKLRSLDFHIVSCDVPPPYEVRWKVKNTGTEARRKAALRGRIYCDEGRGHRKESTLYWGNHYVECYVIKDGVCVAADHLEVPIGPRE